MQAQLLDQPRPGDLLEVVRHLTVLQTEPTAPLGAPSADLVLWSRLGSAYDRAELADLIDQQVLIEHQGFLRPSEDIALFRAEMSIWPGREPLKEWQRDTAAWVRANDGCRLRDPRRCCGARGRCRPAAFADTCEVPWPSSGWNNNRNVQMLLKLMVARGEVAAAGPRGAARSSGTSPSGSTPTTRSPTPTRRGGCAASGGCGRSGWPGRRSTEQPGEPHHVGEVGEPAVVEGVRGEWRVEPTLLDRPFTGRAALLSPFDRLVQDRKRLDQLFEFDYLLEMYKPVEQRIWGYYALPILHGDRLVGKLDATAEPAEGVLRVDAVHEDEPGRRRRRQAVAAEIEDLARWLDLEVMRIG